eukprot:scaffold1803_cov261-Pinguiococcus_pyrenoidosus.AAC.2
MPAGRAEGEWRTLAGPPSVFSWVRTLPMRHPVSPEAVVVEVIGEGAEAEALSVPFDQAR